MRISEEQVLQALKVVEDPDLRRDIVALNMVSDILIDENKISFRITLTTPACPVKESIKEAAVNAIHLHIDKNVEVEVTMDANTSTRRMDKQVVLPDVKNIIAVVSGKGGVGKSTIAVNLALGLAKLGAKVGIIDADIYGPSLPMMLDIKGQRPRVKDVDGKPIIIPLEKYGVKALSIGLLIDEKQAVVWRGPMVSSALKQFVNECDWGELDYLVFDMPPGTGDIHLTLVQNVPVTGAIVVTTPQEVALADARKAMGMFTIPQINIPIIGVVENMAYFTPEELPENKYFIFGQGGGERLAEEFHVPMLGQIPIVQTVCESGDNGIPSVMNENSLIGKAFLELAQNVVRSVSVRNANFTAEKKAAAIV
jgi:ATP-binding protein involved in chromosome partitioning